MSRKLTILEVKERLKEINPNIEILSENYYGAKTKLQCKCLIDGFEWNVRWDNLRVGQGCPVCGKKTQVEKQRLTLEEVKYRLYKINPNIQILSNKYTNNETKLHCKCLIDNHEWYAKWQNLSQGTGCPKCGIISATEKQMFSIEEVKEKLKTINKNIEIISNEYKGAKGNLTCKCLIDGNIWNTFWDKLRQGICCPICGIKRISGENNYHYNPNLTDKERKLQRKILGEDIDKWRRSIFKKDNYTCQCCRNRSSKNNKVIINAHHLNGYNWDNEHRIDINNGVTLCEECHKEFHSIYGYGYNTKEQYDEWVNNKMLNSVI